MTASHHLLEELGHRARRLEPSAQDVKATLRRLDGRTARLPARLVAGRSLGSLAFALAILMLGAAMALPAPRAALTGAIDSFFGGAAPGHDVTGRPVSGAQLPRWLRSETHRGLIVAGAGHNRLVAYRMQGAFCFAYGSGVGECASGSEWRRQLAHHPAVLRGPTGGVGHPIGTLYGFTRGDVASVRLTFRSRAPLSASARHGGFAINTDARWDPRELKVLDARGKTIATLDVADRFTAYR
jgi:hypothetical protein